MIIEGRFNGPPGSGNGGYSAGLIASQLPGPGPVQVTLRRPPPLDMPLQVTADGEVYAGEQLIAQTQPAELAGQPPAPVPYDQAVRAAAAYPGLVDHPFPTCYVCGPDRADGDGLRIFPGPLPGGRTAAPWQVPAGAGEPEVWAALDCPGGWTVLAPGRPYLLGRIAAQVERLPGPGAGGVVVGEVIATQGRKAQVRTALYVDDQLLARAEATWIAIQ